jgi:L-seryl-tRNA(Ser) seleniumtransferase
MGMLAAVEMWVKRDHKAEWQVWESWLDQISTSVKRINGVSARVVQPSPDLSNRTPRLVIEWDGARLGIIGPEAGKLLLDGEPRIVVAGSSGSRPGNLASSVSIVPYMMMPGEAKIVADRLFATLSKPPKLEDPPAPQAPAVTVAGQWVARLEFGNRGSASHNLVLEQDGDKLTGTHYAEFDSGDLNGSVSGKTVRFQSSYRIQGQRLSYTFTGTVDGEKMSGTVNMGEYGETKWTAERHKYRPPAGRRNA